MIDETVAMLERKIDFLERKADVIEDERTNLEMHKAVLLMVVEKARESLLEWSRRQETLKEGQSISYMFDYLAGFIDGALEVSGIMQNLIDEEEQD